MVFGTCEECVFFNRVRDIKEITKVSGTCHRFPPAAFPVPHPQGVAVMTVWVTVQGADGCGEFAEEDTGEKAGKSSLILGSK